jgi:hypothetical protein
MNLIYFWGRLQNSKILIYDCLLAEWTMLGVVMLTFVVFGQMQGKGHICGGQDKTNCRKNKQYFSAIFFHFQNFMNTMSIDLQFPPVACES